MKIAILLPGHIRAWDYCKDNFMNNLYDTNHSVDVFIDTYNDIFRNDYHLHKENEVNIIKNNNEILSLFDGINVVDFKVESMAEANSAATGMLPRGSGDAETMQIRKILRVVDTYEQYENLHGKYDLVVRTRFDLILEKKLNYESIFENCKNSKLIYIGNGAVHMPQNDMFAVCNTDTFKIYGKRFIDLPKVHASMDHIKNSHGVSYSQTINISIVRLGGPGNVVNFNNKNYRVFS